MIVKKLTALTNKAAGDAIMLISTPPIDGPMILPDYH